MPNHMRRYLAERIDKGQSDRQIFEEVRRRGIPVATTLAGGYARRVEDTIRIHLNTILAAQEVAEKFPKSS